MWNKQIGQCSQAKIGLQTIDFVTTILLLGTNIKQIGTLLKTLYIHRLLLHHFNIQWNL
jgi:hypothetical protein